MDCKMRINSMFKQNLIKCHLETAWPFVLFIWSNLMWYWSLAALQKQKKGKKEIYIKYIYTDLSLHKTALVKGYIFPLQLKINKMVSNIPQYFLFVFLVFPVKGEPINDDYYYFFSDRVVTVWWATPKRMGCSLLPRSPILFFSHEGSESLVSS